MEIQFWQIILLTLYGGLAIWDSLNPGFGFNNPVVGGLFAGTILGNMEVGLLVGGTLQLMILGVGTYGGASIPDYSTGALLGTAFAISSGQGLEFGLAIAVPVGLLLVQFDVLARFTNTYFQHMADAAVEVGDYKKVELGNLLGTIPWCLSRALAIFLALFFGADLVNSLLAASPTWLLNGLKVAGGLLPAVGIAILLRYLPLNKFYAYVVLGFIASTYLKVPMLGVALIGFALAVLVFNRRNETPQYAGAATTQGGLIEDDE